MVIMDAEPARLAPLALSVPKTKFDNGEGH